MVRRLIPWIAFGLPVAYIGIILAVVVHEIIGHGVTAVLCGGSFQKFVIYPDGGGMAWTNEPEGWGRAAVLAGGITSDFVFGLLFLLVSMLRRLGMRTRLVLVIFATTLFHDGLPYGLWGALLEGPRGDISNLLIYLAPAEKLRIVLIAVFGVVYPLTMVVTSRAIFRTIEDGVGAMSHGLASVLAATMTVCFAAGYATFEWDTLIEGAGMYPTVTVTVLQAAIGVWLVRRRRVYVERVAFSSGSWAVLIVLAWAAMAATLAVTLMWLQHSVEIGWG